MHDKIENNSTEFNDNSPKQSINFDKAQREKTLPEQSSSPLNSFLILNDRFTLFNSQTSSKWKIPPVLSQEEQDVINEYYLRSLEKKNKAIVPSPSFRKKMTPIPVKKGDLSHFDKSPIRDQMGDLINKKSEEKIGSESKSGNGSPIHSPR